MKRLHMNAFKKFISVDYRSYLKVFGSINDLLLEEFEQRELGGGELVSSADDQGAAIVHDLEWDSEIFNCKCSRVGTLAISESYSGGLAGEIDLTFKRASTEFADVRMSLQHSELIKEFMESGWCVADQLNIYFGKLAQLSVGSSEQSQYVIGGVSPEHAELFFKKNPKLFGQTRIYNDSKIHTDTAELFYTRLMEAKCAKLDGPMCGVWQGETLAGIAIGEIDPQLSEFMGAPFACLWLIGLSEKVRGKGLGKILLKAFLSQCHDLGVAFLEIGTQHNNLPANNLYSLSGLSLQSQLITLHRWYD